jgi:NAD(P)-dependent dehydrogenase (short-subunit alcohol dehydrogenase family)
MDKVALITGAGRGMARAMSLGLLENGYSVAAVDRDAGPLRELTSLANGRGGQLFTIQANLMQPDLIEGVVAQAERRFGRVDILVNNAGMGQSSIRPDNWQRPIKFWEVTQEQWQRFSFLNATVPFLLARLVAGGMISRRWGRIINVTTSLGNMLRGGGIPYGPTKASEEAQIGVFADDLVGTGVTANVLVPGGPTNTDFIPHQAGLDRTAMLQPDVMVKPLLWLVSDAANAVTGRRYTAAKWDASLPDERAAAAAGASVGWRDAGPQVDWDLSGT